MQLQSISFRPIVLNYPGGPARCSRRVR
jgi:hypothetical protein